MSWPIVRAAFACALASSRSSSEAPARREPVLGLPPPSRWKHVPSERRIKTELVEHDDYGVVRSATRYSPCEWEALPWMLTVWTDADEDADVFALAPHRDVSEDDLRVSVFWSYEKPYIRNFRDYAVPIGRDQRFQNRLIHRGDVGLGTFLIEVCFQGNKVTFFHRSKAKQLPEKRVRNSAPVLPPPPPPDPFEVRLAPFIRLQEQYEQAKGRIRERKLPEIIEIAALDEVERVFQDEVDKLDEDTPLGK